MTTLLQPAPTKMADATPPTSAATATVCQLLHTLKVGGAEVLAARLGRQLRDRYRFFFVCLDDLGELGEGLRRDGFEVEVLRRRPGLDWRLAWRLGRFLKRERVDIVHAHQYTPFFYGAAAARMFYRKVAVLFTEHGRHQPDYPRRKRMLANRLLLGRPDRVVGVGEAVRQALIVNEGIPADRVETIYNGVDLTPYALAHDRAQVRQELGLHPDDFAVFQVARLDYLKDHLTAVRALARVVQQQPRARLVLVGEGPEEAKIRQQVHESNVTESVVFLGLRKDVPRLLSAADAFLLTSTSEGIPLTLIEAMAAGLPVVSTNVGGVAEVVEEGTTGLLAPSGDDAALAGHLLRLAGDVGLRRSLAGQGRDRAHARFAEPLMHAGYVRCYEEMLGRHPR